MIAEDGLKWELALMGWRAGKNISLNASLAAMFVCRNRFLAGLRDGDWLKNIRAIPVGSVDPDIRQPDFTEVLAIVDSVFDGTRRDTLTVGGLYFSTPDMPDWFLKTDKERVSALQTMVIYK